MGGHIALVEEQYRVPHVKRTIHVVGDHDRGDVGFIGQVKDRLIDFGRHNGIEPG